MPAFNGNYFDEEGQLRNLDGGFVNGDGWVNGQSPFNGAFIGSDGEVHNLSELSGGGSDGSEPDDDKELTFSVPPMYTREVEFKGIQWDEYFIDQSCTVASSSPVFVDVWMCGGGGSGTGSTTSATGAGGGGGYILYCDNYPIALPTSIYIGEGGVSGFSGQATSLGGRAALGGMAATTNDGGAGGSGGGGARTSAASAGLGTPANEYTFYYPFGDVENFCEGNPVVGPLCAGGGGSTGTTDAKQCTYGGEGGSNGSDGETGGSNSNDPALFIAGGLGGAVGGGHGGGADRENNTPEPGSPGTNYGAGGGGGARTRPASTGTYVTSAGGDGYQGCVIIRVPKK
ncbi:hypothetical protein AGMMS49992_32640 [Clostridia bacterium]|nr:hypothetical protein AGMMS49992_32640 [Clostridia bacterium]